MGRDNHPHARQLRRQAAKDSQRASYPRILIVTEGSKTEPAYFGEIRAAYQLHSANIAVQPSQFGTSPLQVVRYAEHLFKNGDLHRGIRPRSFDQLFVVFDRDDHESYFQALDLAKSHDGKMRNDEKEKLHFKAIASNPCFELWLLLHFEEIWAPIHRNEVFGRLRHHLPRYQKGDVGVFAATRASLEQATARARALAGKFNAYSDPEPFTGLYELVTLLTTLRA